MKVKSFVKACAVGCAGAAMAAATLSPSSASAGVAAPTDVDLSQIRVTSMRFSPPVRTEGPKRFSPLTLTMGVSHPVGVDLKSPHATWVRANKAPCAATSVACSEFDEYAFGAPKAKYTKVSPTYTTIRVALDRTLVFDNGTGSTTAPKGLYRVAEVRLPYLYPCDANPGAGCFGQRVVPHPPASFRHYWATRTKISSVTRRGKRLVVIGRAFRNKYTDTPDDVDEVIGGRWKGWRKARVSVWFDPAGKAAPRRVKGVKVDRTGTFRTRVPARGGGKYVVRQATRGWYYQSSSRRF